MTTKDKLGIYLMTAKGLAVIKQLLAELGSGRIAFVVVARDAATLYDGSEDILQVAHEAGIPAFEREQAPESLPKVRYLLAVSWRWLIPIRTGQQLIVFHDSLLPRYRGFAPLVSALVNKETTLGVTALLASTEYDRGPIIAQEAIGVNYPLTVREAIQLITPCYERLASTLSVMISNNSIEGLPQDETMASYSLWRDEEDYLVDWSWDAERIRRFVDGVGYPYKGAAVSVGGKVCRIRLCLELPDVVIENRTPGKVIFIEDGMPVVVCGKGLLKVLQLTADTSGADMLPLAKFRVRF